MVWKWVFSEADLSGSDGPPFRGLDFFIRWRGYTIAEGSRLTYAKERSRDEEVTERTRLVARLSHHAGRTTWRADRA